MLHWEYLVVAFAWVEKKGMGIQHQSTELIIPDERTGKNSPTKKKMSRNRRRASSYNVSNTSEVLPDQETPSTTVKPSPNSTPIPFGLCSMALQI